MKLLKIIFGLLVLALVYTQTTYAAEVTKWHSPIVDVYISKDYDNYRLMYDAYNEWCNASNRRFLFNLSSTKGMGKNGHIKVYFNQEDTDSITETPRPGLNYPEVKINIVTNDKNGKPYPLDYIYPKMLHYAGISLGLEANNNPKSVLNNTTEKNQTILLEDVFALCNLYGWKIPNRLRYFR